MRQFFCNCGVQVFFNNSMCMACGNQLGFDPAAFTLATLDSADNQGVWLASKPASYRYRFCANREQLCNWLLPATSNDTYCLACQSTRTIPNLSSAGNSELWVRLEAAKRRLFYTLLMLNLPVANRDLRFNFLEDRQTNPLVREINVNTGHQDGMITINVAEADDVAREAIRESVGEAYRTLLGHFRHESGHYYWPIVIHTEAALAECRQLFGNERTDYAAALERYYSQGPAADWAKNYVTPYASSHPQEDWAECWAHFLHISDALETGRAAGWLPDDANSSSDSWLEYWAEASVWLNEMNRSLGLPDAYPFVLSQQTRVKLEFIRRQVGEYSSQPSA